MACDCISKINENLKPHNAQLSLGYVLDGPRAGTYPQIETRLIEKRRGKRAPTMVPTYCPWCGLNYKTGLPATQKAEG